MISTSSGFSAAPHGPGRPQRALMYLAKAVTWRASSRVWLAAYSCAPWSQSTWQSAAERFSAPCSPCRIEEKLASCIAVDEADPLLRIGERLGDVGQAEDRIRSPPASSASFSMSKGVSKSMYFLSSGSQKWSWVAAMILSKAVERCAVAVELEHRLEVVRRHRAVHCVLGDVAVGHGASPGRLSAASQCRSGAAASQRPMTYAR